MVKKNDWRSCWEFFAYQRSIVILLRIYRRSQIINAATYATTLIPVRSIHSATYFSLRAFLTIISRVPRAGHTAFLIPLAYKTELLHGRFAARDEHTILSFDAALNHNLPMVTMPSLLSKRKGLRSGRTNGGAHISKTSPTWV